MVSKQDPLQLDVSLPVHPYIPVVEEEDTDQQSIQLRSACALSPSSLFSFCRGRRPQSRDFSRGPEGIEDGEFQFICRESRTYAKVYNDGDCYVCYDQFEDDDPCPEQLSRRQVAEGVHELKRQEEQKLKVVQDKLPAWALNAEAARASSTWNTSTGPVIPLLRASVIVSMSMQVALFCGLRATRSCAGVAKVTSSMKCSILVLLVGRAVIEWQALKHALPTFVQGCQFRALGLPICFPLWLFLYLMLSQLSFIDIVTDTLFAASVTNMLECHPIGNAFWHEAWQQSLWRWARTPSLWWMVAGWWAVSLLQFVIPVLKTLRRKDMTCNQSSFEFRHQGVDQAVCCHRKGYPLSNGCLFYRLAFANGMMSLQALTTPLLSYILSSHTVVDTPLLTSRTNQMRLMNQLTDLVLEQLILCSILESAVQLNLQSTIYAMGIASEKLTTGDEPELTLRLLYLAMVATWLMTVVKIVEATNLFHLHNMPKPAGLKDDEDARSFKRSSQRNMRMIGLAGLILIGSLVYASTKVVMAHICKDAMWNLFGCVDLHLQDAH